MLLYVVQFIFIIHKGAIIEQSRMYILYVSLLDKYITVNNVLDIHIRFCFKTPCTIRVQNNSYKQLHEYKKQQNDTYSKSSILDGVDVVWHNNTHNFTHNYKPASLFGKCMNLLYIQLSTNTYNHKFVHKGSM